MQAEAASSLGASLGAERVVAALKSAAAATGSDFHYLLGTAMRESSLKPSAQSSTSSAAGLFQFIDQTWLGLVKEHGAQHGLANYAAAISKDSDGRYHADSGAKQSILALRKDPEAAALMAGEYAKSTQGAMRAVAGPRGLRRRALCRPFPGPRCGLQADQGGGQRSGRQRRGAVSPGRRRQQKRVLPCRRRAQIGARSL